MGGDAAGVVVVAEGAAIEQRFEFRVRRVGVAGEMLERPAVVEEADDLPEVEEDTLHARSLRPRKRNAEYAG